MQEPARHDEKTTSENRLHLTSVAWLGIVGLIFTATQIWMTHQKDQFDQETRKFDIASKKFDIIMNLLQKCSSSNASDREFANRYIGATKTASIVAFNDYLAKDAKFNDAMSSCMNIVQNTEANATSVTAISAPLLNELPPPNRRAQRPVRGVRPV